MDLDNLPDGSEVVTILKDEKSQLHIWSKIAIAYYRKGRVEEFYKVLEESRTFAATEYENYERDQTEVLDLMAAYYIQQANKERDKNKKKELFSKATYLYTTADKIFLCDQNHLLGRAYLCMLEGDKMEQADAQFNFVLKEHEEEEKKRESKGYQLQSNSALIPALLGKACISYNKKDYKSALAFYRKALRTKSDCPAEIRLGFAYCFLKLNNQEKARMAFQRALDIDPGCVGALVGLAIMDFNSQTTERIRMGVERLSKAYSIDNTNPMLLNHLANHFFFKKQYDKAQMLAFHAFHFTENETMKGESFYQIARYLSLRDETDKIPL